MTFETFTVSREEISNPLLPEIIRAGRTLAEHGCNAGVVSARYGNRVVLSTGPLSDLEPAAFVELADYDPTRTTAMVIGAHAPPQSTPLHWLLYRRSETNAAIQLHRTFDDIETADCDPTGDIDELMEALRLLRDSACVNLDGEDCIAIGGSIAAALEEIPCV